MIIFLGIAGSGKTEQSKLLAKQFGYGRISVGELLRNNTDQATRVRMNAGDLIDDDIVIPIVEDAIKNLPLNKEYIIDGFPRTLNEAIWTSEKRNNKIMVFQIMLSREEAIKRLKLRNRKDDNDEAILKRFDEYQDLIESILKVFSKDHISIYKIDGSQNIASVHEQIIRHLKINKER